MPSKLLALPWYGAGDTPLEEPLVVCGPAEFAKKAYQNAGRAFWEVYEEPLCDNSGDDTPKDDEDRQAETEREMAYKEKQKKKKEESKKKDGGLLKVSDDLKGKDLYELLEVDFSASGDDIKKSYRKLVLIHHPDKMINPTEDQKKHFLLLQEAFDIMSDENKRKRYESALDFDEYIPTGFGRGKLADADFFEIFQPVFKSNSRWSNRKPVPDLGDESTSIEKVKAFYAFWYSFDSWRDPIAMAEKDECDLHCLDEAECREERRWMERENARVAKKYLQAERERVSDLVKVAEKNDPRMIAHKEAIKKAREAEKEKKAAAARADQEKKEAEAKIIAAEKEAIRAEEEAKRQKEKRAREEVKGILKAARQRLRTLHRNAETAVRRAVHSEQLQEVCLRLGADELNVISEELEGEFAKASGDWTKVIEVMHREIEKVGITPIPDESVEEKGEHCGTSTASGDSDCCESEDDRIPARELTPEEKEQERLRQLAEAEAERERQEKKAEEARKRKERIRQDEEKRLAAQRKIEKKEREAVAKQAERERKKDEKTKKEAEEQRLKNQQMKEEQRQRQIDEENEKKRAHEEQLVSRAFEEDRTKRCQILEAYDDSILTVAFNGTLLQEGTGQADAHLKFALKQIAATVPEIAETKAEANDPNRRELEEFSTDLALACLTGCATYTPEVEDARSRLAGGLALAIRQTKGTPELSKEAKAMVKKVRTRVRAAVLAWLRGMAPAKPVAEPTSGAAKQPVGDQAPPAEAIKAGTELIVAEEATLFQSLDSYDDLGTLAAGKLVVASGQAQDVEGYPMVPIKPEGAVELRLLRAVAAPSPAPKVKASPAKGKGNPATAKKTPDPQSAGHYRDFVSMASTGPNVLDEVCDALLAACLGGFDREAALSQSEVISKAKVEDKVESEAQESPAKPNKKGKAKPQEEDLDALLEEFGMTPQAGKKKKGKK